LHFFIDFILGGSTNPPFDESGHDTHILSTTVRNFVHDANVLGNANDTLVSMSLHAHIAIYKVCTLLFGGANDVILATTDDGVNIMSISLGFFL